eukprot:TRINITY_DN364_c0_g2_i1.p1 TRINITY_DN364_c0_g2~~TRINITY_DN364_c0_g2_i1.p1  ORF type:complete len:326 (-),score=32.13 TRINITY_DN364_c0_g2_i1:205-1182(-)
MMLSCRRAHLTRWSVVCIIFATIANRNASAVSLQRTARQPGEANACIVDGKPRRIAWFHIPKTGSSLGNLISHYLRPDFPADAVVPQCEKETCEHVDKPSDSNREFQYRYDSNTWFHDCLWLKPGHGPNNTDWFAHASLSTLAWKSWKGSFVGMFRDPSQRALSSWDSFAGAFAPILGRSLSKEEWARRIEGTATKMLAGQEFPMEASLARSNKSLIVPNLELALSRFEGFLFVGLVEHWALSVCLFHRITKSACNPHDIENTREDGNRGGKPWNTSELNDYVDPYDTKLYLAATDRFWRDVRKHGLTTKVCQQTCPWFDPQMFH